jgi:hypothetical protein
LGFANFKKPPISWQSTKSCNKVATSIICILQNLELFSSVICFQILFLVSDIYGDVCNLYHVQK